MEGLSVRISTGMNTGCAKCAWSHPNHGNVEWANTTLIGDSNQMDQKGIHGQHLAHLWAPQLVHACAIAQLTNNMNPYLQVGAVESMDGVPFLKGSESGCANGPLRAKNEPYHLARRNYRGIIG